MEKNEKREKKVYLVPAVEKAASVLEYLAEANKECSLLEVHTNLNLPKTTTHSILNTLLSCGLIRKNNSGLFAPGLKLYTMGLLARAAVDKGHMCLPILEKLRNETGFTVYLCAYDNGEQVVLEKLDGFGTVVFKAYVGQRKIMNTSASGKAMAAFLSENELKLMLSKGLNKLTANSIVTKDEFLAHLEQIRSQGYAVDDEEGEIGVRCLGVPVFINKQIYGSVSIATLKDNLPYGDFPEYIELLKAAASEIAGRFN